MVELIDRTLATKDNRFISGFFLPQLPNLRRLNEVAAEIAFERASWQNSGAAEQCLEELKTIYENNGASHPFDNPRVRIQQLAQIRNTLYGNIESSSSTQNATSKIFGNSPPRMKQQFGKLIDRAVDYQKQFNVAIKDLVDQRNTLSRDLVENWGGFMSSNHQSFADFGYFLGAEEFNPEREISRPFLEALQTRIDRMIDPIIQNLINDTIADIPPHLFGEFVGQLIEQNSRGKRHNTTLQWLKLVSFPSEDISPEIIIDKIINAATFPNDLKMLFTDYLQQGIKRDADGVKSQLLSFKPAIVPMMFVEYRKVNLPRRAGSTTGGRRLKVITKPKDSTTEPEKQTYQLALHDRGPIFPGQFETYVTDNADRFAAGDQRMRSDIRNILSALETDPFGFGVAKLTSMKIASSEDTHRPLALRRFRADQRPGLTLNHEESRRLRVVFYLDPGIHPNEVILYDILNHEEFDKKFT